MTETPPAVPEPDDDAGHADDVTPADRIDPDEFPPADEEAH